MTLGRTRILLRTQQVHPLIDSAWRTGRTYLAARDAFRRELVALAQQEAGGSKGLFRSGPTPIEVEAAVTGTGGPLERIWPTVTAPEVVRDLLNSRQRLASAAAGDLTAEEQAALQRDRKQLLRDELWTAADMPLLDEADAAVRGTTSSYGYVLADEAQDLSPMQLRMVFRRSTAGRGTLVGDIAQATGPTRFPDWTDLLAAAAVDDESRIAELAIGYRVPRQVMELASALLPRIAPDIMAPRAVREGPEEPRLLQVDEASLATALVNEVATRLDGDRSIGVVVADADVDSARAALIEAGLEPGDILSDGLNRQVTVLSADQAKGLEFDHVVVLDPAAIAGAAEDWAYVYIALTRATRTLSVLYRTVAPFEIAMPEPEREPESDASTEADATPALAGPQAGTILGPRYTEALMQAKFLHASHRRRGTLIPYMAHLQSVSALVLEDGGSEDEAIAALLHDAVEEYEPGVLEMIVEQFGMEVGRIVAGCADPDPEPGVGWRELKMRHMRELESAGPQVRRVALAEKLDNARAVLRDYRRVGEGLWASMDVNPDDLLWYYDALADLFVTERPGDMASELQDTVERLLDAAAEPETVS
jgi:hypothetical protein